MIDEIESLASGECRWIGRHDVHVYCRAPMVETLMPSGRMGWQPGPASYCVVCPEAGLEYGEFVDAPRAAKLVAKALKDG
jgi:hypothetical protein